MKYSLCPQEIPRAPPSGFLSGSGYISQCIPPLVTIQIQLVKEGVRRVQYCSGALVRVYVAEQSGVSLGTLLYSSQPGEKDSCGQLYGNQCRKKTSRKLSCRNVTMGGQVYSCTCLTCGGGRAFLLISWTNIQESIQ